MTAKNSVLIGGRYRLGQALGRGGMAAVHRAVDEQLGRAVAVKLMRAELGAEPAFRGRFVNEARNAASISHPNVVTVFDFGTDGPSPYIVMELVEGGDLAGLIARDAPLAPQRAASVAAEVAAALQAAHGRGIVHRDVKPGNILIAADGHPRVADFGIARATGEQSLTNTGTSFGSVEYFSPEQARGEPATAASDLYALGVVLYEMLTGVRPFTGDTSYAVAVARLQGEPPDPRAGRPEIPKPLAAIVRRAMAIDPLARFPSAAEMGAALEKWVARNPAPEASLAALAVAPAAHGGHAVANAAGASNADTAPLTPKVPVARKPRARKAAAVAAAASAAIAAPLADAVPKLAARSVRKASADPAAETRPVALVAPASAPAPIPAAPAAVVATPPQSSATQEEDRRRRRPAFVLLAAAVVLLAVLGFVGGRMFSSGGDVAQTDVTIGEPRGAVFGATTEPTPSPTAEPTVEPTVEPTAEPTEQPTVAPTAVPVITPAPIAVATPAPRPPAPPRATPAPTPAVVAQAITPDQTVATWYSYVEGGQFDAAYALWGDRMKSNYPRQGNLDNRWRDTADVAIRELYVVEQNATYALVHIDFVETKDNGASRRFIGAWELVRSGDGWLLDQPHF